MRQTMLKAKNEKLQWFGVHIVETHLQNLSQTRSRVKMKGDVCGYTVTFIFTKTTKYPRILECAPALAYKDW